VTPRLLIRLGLSALIAHRLRSALSVVGVVFGVAAVVAMMSVGEGARREALDQIGSLGIDTVTLRARPPDPKQVTRPLELRAARSVREVVPGLSAVSPLRVMSLDAEVGNRSLEVTALGTTPDYREATRLELEAGRFLADLDVSRAARVAVLGAVVARQLFPLREACGEWVRLDGDWFRVVGVLTGRDARGRRSGPLRSHDVNRSVIVPLVSLDRGDDAVPDGIDEITVRVAPGTPVVSAARALAGVAERSSGGTSVDVVVPLEILRREARAQRVFNVVTGAVAAISLIVGGIGIMNVMLASVAERTGEVGIRRALGASRRDVGAQFLVEAALLTSVGGLFGGVLGALGSELIQRLADWPTAMSPMALAFALVMAVGVGLGFGFYPAWRAAHLQPMEALRRG
jgi:putative ABC transport system permease protein